MLKMCHKHWVGLFLVAISVLPSAPLRAETLTIVHSSFEQFDLATRDRFVVVDREPAGIRLARSYLITNEMGVTGKCWDTLGKDDLARIQFDIPIPDMQKALLLIYRGTIEKHLRPKTDLSYTQPEFVEVNGRRRPYIHDEERMLTGGWARHDVQADELKAGLNEIVIGGGGLHVDPFSHAGKSARSFDGGQTFKMDLGSEGQWSGEYIVRLRIYGHPPTGEVVSPVIDPAINPQDPVIRPKVAVQKVTVNASQLTPTDTCVDYFVRSGTTPIVSARHWTIWQPIKLGQAIPVPGHRYLQWRAVLHTDSSSKTPVIREVRLDLQAEIDRAAREGISTSTYENPTLVNSSYPFLWESDTPRIRHLREKYRLREVVENTDDELTRHALLRKWVSHAWNDGWHNGKYDYVPPWNALELLEFAKRSLSRGMCTHYSCTYVQTAASVGYSVRSVIIDHHCVTEIWSEKLGKWMLQDPGPGAGPEGYPVGFAYKANGQWLSALDVHRGYLEKRKVQAVPYKDLKEPYVLDDEWMKLFVRFGMPLRNNHLSQPAPAEIEHGAMQYRWDGYLWWSDNLDEPAYPEYSQLTNRVADFYYPLNVVAVDLQQQDRNTLTVNLATQTPNFLRYEVAINGKPFEPVESGFTWKLDAGANRLKVRSVNTFGISGRESSIVIEHRDK